MWLSSVKIKSTSFLRNISNICSVPLSTTTRWILGKCFLNSRKSSLKNRLQTELDIARRMLPSIVSGVRKSSSIFSWDSEFIICAEHEEKVHFFASVDNPLLNKENISLKELCTEDFVLTESNMSYRKLLNNELAAQSLEIHPVLEIGNPLQICSLIKNSKMISFLPDFITEDYYNSGEIKHLPINDCDVSVWTQLLIHKNKWKSPALNAFIDFYRDVIRK